MICAACGNENRARSRFCDNCGAGLAVTCPQCSEPNRPDARFCASCGQVLTATDATAAAGGPRTQPAEAERRLVTILFTDLVGFTSLAEDRDPEAVRELLSAYFDSATRIVQLHGGIVEKFIGDAVMAVWGTPVAHEDDAERAVRAALELVDAVRGLHPDLQARAGVLTGEAAVTLAARNQGMVAGDLVNTAARLQGVAEPGNVLVGEATRRAAEGAVVFEPIGDRSVKGKTAPVPAWRALRVVANRGGQGRADALEPPFVGREEELRELKEVLHAGGRDRWVRLVSITGPAGIGKSRLAWELEKYVDGVAENIYWHRGRSPSYGDGVAFWALGEMVRRRADLTEDADEATTRAAIASAIAEYVPDASERERIGPALLTLLGVEEAPPGGRDTLFPAWRLYFERIAERGTTVLVFEDLQWADTGLLDFIDHLLDWSRDLPILVVTLARPELFDRRPDWGAKRRHLTALALEPLTDDEIRRLLEGLVPGLPAAAVGTIASRAEGVPLYAVEMVRGLLTDGRIERRGDAYVPLGDLSTITVPESLRSLIASRLDGLEPTDRALLQDAAVLGDVFATEALAAVNGTGPDELAARLRDLVRRELLDVERDPRSPDRGQHKFVQSLIREVAYGTLARRDRRSRHLAAARHYESLGDELAGALASHYLAARGASDPGPEADAITTQARLALSGAAERAASLGGYDQAVEYLDKALAITTDPADRAPLLDRAAEAASVAARPSEQYARGAIDAYREMGDQLGAVGATARFGKWLIQAGEIPRATQVLEAALAEAEAIGDEPTLALTLANLSRAHMRAAAREQSLAAADRSLAIAERLNLEEIVAEALINKASALSQLGRRRESLALHESVVRMAVNLPSRDFEMRARNNMIAALFEDDPAGATRLTFESMEMARQVGARGMYNWLTGIVTFAVRSSGRGWDEHIERLREALDTATVRSDRVRLRGFRSTLEMVRGEDLEGGVRELEQIVGDSTDPDDRFILLMTSAFSAVMQGDADSAYARSMEAGTLPTQNSDTAPGLALRAAIWAGDADRIRIAASAVQQAPWTGPVGLAVRGAAAAAAAYVDGHTGDAVESVRESIASFQRLEQPFDAAELAVDAAILMPSELEIRRLAEEQRPLLEELRARPLLERLDAALDAKPLPSPATSAIAVETPSSGS